jgi:hypothetical protein
MHGREWCLSQDHRLANEKKKKWWCSYSYIVLEHCIYSAYTTISYRFGLYKFVFFYWTYQRFQTLELVIDRRHVRIRLAQRAYPHGNTRHSLSLSLIAYVLYLCKLHVQSLQTLSSSNECPVFVDWKWPSGKLDFSLCMLVLFSARYAHTRLCD